MENIIQLKVRLNRTFPEIWRRIQVEKTTSFFELHHIIQIVMGWENYHMFEFNFNGYRIGEPNDEMVGMGFGSKDVLDSKDIKLDSIITDITEIFDYDYDFGDGWNHRIIVEEFHPKKENIQYPRCIEGALKCPPEDCGGIGGYYNLLNVINNKKHPERKEMLEWLGRKYDPNEFNLKKINLQLSKLEKYILDWMGDEE